MTNETERAVIDGGAMRIGLNGRCLSDLPLEMSDDAINSIREQIEHKIKTGNILALVREEIYRIFNDDEKVAAKIFNRPIGEYTDAEILKLRLEKLILEQENKKLKEGK